MELESIVNELELALGVSREAPSSRALSLSWSSCCMSSMSVGGGSGMLLIGFGELGESRLSVS